MDNIHEKNIVKRLDVDNMQGKILMQFKVEKKKHNGIVGPLGER